MGTLIFLYYLADVVEALGELFGALSVSLVLTLGGFLFTAAINNEEHRREHRTTALKLARRLARVATITITVAVLMPTKTTMHLILGAYAAGTILEMPAVQKVNEDLPEIYDLVLEKLRHELTVEKPEGK